MRINGFLGTSLIEYPGKLAAVIYTSPCNFRCGFCHNSYLILENEDVIDQKDILKQIDERKAFIDAVVITGGEPTMQPDLKRFMLKIKETGLKTKLDTNGYDPENLRDIIENKAVDYVAMDIKTSLPRYKEAARVEVDIEKIRESIELIMKSGIDYEFRTTVVPGLVAEKDIIEIGEAVKGAKLFALQQFSNRNCFDTRLAGVMPYTLTELNHFAAAMKKYAVKVEIRNV